MIEHKKGLLVIVSGFSGAGKGTVVHARMDKFPGRYKLSVSATTREPRSGEKDGVNYFFVTREKFEKMIADGELLEYAEYVGNYYGTPRRFVEEQMDAGYNVILEIEQQGAFKVKKAFPDAVLIFLTPPSIDELERRLRGRHSESEETIQKRLAQAAIEAENIELYDYLVINDDIDGCAVSMDRLIESVQKKTRYNQERIDDLRAHLQHYRKDN